MTIVWEWPLLTIALLSGIIVSSFDAISSVSTVHSWLGVPFPVAIELAVFSLAWYVSAALVRVKWWLLPTIGFVVAALLLQTNSFWVLFGVTIVSAVLAFAINRIASRDWASPLYIVTLLAAVMTGIAGHTHDHLLLATTWVLLAFALLVYIIGTLEDWTPWLWIMPVFATWSLVDSAVLLGDLFRPPMVVLISAAVAMAIGLLKLFAQRRNRFVRYVLPFYAIALAAAVLTGIDGMLFGLNQSFYGVMPVPGTVPVALLLYAVVAFGVLLVEPAPEALVFPVVLAVWAIGEIHLALWQLMIAYSMLCVLIFASQFIWKIIPPATNWLPATWLHRVFGLVGQALVVLFVIQQDGLSAGSGPLAHAGAGALFVLALLLFWFGRLQHEVTVQRYCAYGAGALLSPVVPWELLAFRQTNLDLLTLAPASYLSVIGPFLMREEALRQHHRIGQAVSLVGAALLLLPTLWLSFSANALLYTLILLGESLVLLLLGLGLRVRILILCGAGLIVVDALHALFLTTSSTPLALAGLGVILLLVASGLTLARHRLREAWARWQ